MLKVIAPGCCIVLFIGTFVLLGLLMMGQAVVLMIRSWQSRSWPTTRGTIVHLEHIKPKSDDNWHIVQVRYTYSVNGITYASERIAFRSNPIFSEKAATSLFERLNQSTDVEVRYHPSKPSLSCLESDLPGDNIIYFFLGLFILAFMAIFVLIMISQVIDPER